MALVVIFVTYMLPLVKEFVLIYFYSVLFQETRSKLKLSITTNAPTKRETSRRSNLTKP